MDMAMTSYPAGDQIPITRTFVQSGTTTAIPLLGQVLYDGRTNWVGYNQGSAFYILPSSIADVEPTSLADGSTYYVSEGKGPGGYLATGDSGSSSSPGSMMTSSSSQPSETGSSSSDEPTSTSPGAESSSSTDSAAPSTTSGVAGQVVMSSGGAVVSMFLGLLAWLI